MRDIIHLLSSPPHLLNRAVANHDQGSLHKEVVPVDWAGKGLNLTVDLARISRHLNRASTGCRSDDTPEHCAQRCQPTHPCRAAGGFVPFLTSGGLWKGLFFFNGRRFGDVCSLPSWRGDKETRWRQSLPFSTATRGQTLGST